MVGVLDKSHKSVYDNGALGAEGEGKTEGGGMNRYLVFGGAQYYPGGGWDDCQGDFATLEEAQEKATKVREANDWVEIVDLESMKIIFREEEP